MTARRLPMLEARTGALETCGYCPKLCRGACPVSGVEPREALTPWGKMSMSWMVLRGQLPLDRPHAALAWACSDCHAYRKRCDHDNPADETLMAARGDFYAAGVAPDAACRVSAGREARLARCDAWRQSVQKDRPTSAKTALLVGCDYVRHAPEAAAAALRVVDRLAGPVRLLSGCCGAPEYYAGDRAAWQRSTATLRSQLSGTERLVVADAGCARMLQEAGAITVVELAAQRLDLLRPGGLRSAGLLRWHDPCQLGRGRGVFEAPRQVLQRLLGAAAAEFQDSGEHAACSGGGGLLPVVFPDISLRIAERRLDEHERLGGGTVVTACAASLRRFQSAGGRAVDIVSVIDQSLREDG